MKVDIARAILSEVALGGWLDSEIPEEEQEIIDLAKYYVSEAENWVNEGNPADEHINAIINLSKVSHLALSELADTKEMEAPPGENPVNEENCKEERSENDDLTNIRAMEGLPIPQKLSEKTYDMPVDLTELGDKAIRRLHSAFNSYLGRARWLLAVATSNLSNATHLRDESYRVEYLKAYKRSLSEGEKLSQAILDAVAKDAEDYKAWNERVNDHNKEVTHWKALVDIYSSNVDRLSREWTMRIDERD